MKSRLSADDIRRLFELLNDELARSGTRAEIAVVGGAVMCVAMNARDATRDVDALFEPTAKVRIAAARVAPAVGAPPGWLNDAVRGFMSPVAEFSSWLELSHLSVSMARPEYLLAMKVAAMRLGEEFHDLDDVRFLLRMLDVKSAEAALEIVTRYFDADTLPVKTRLALEGLLPIDDEVRAARNESGDHA